MILRLRLLLAGKHALTYRYGSRVCAEESRLFGSGLLHQLGVEPVVHSEPRAELCAPANVREMADYGRRWLILRDRAPTSGSSRRRRTLPRGAR